MSLILTLTLTMMRSFAATMLMFLLTLAVFTPTIAMARTHRDKSAAPYHLKKVHRRSHPPARYTVMDEEATNAPR